MQWRSTPTCSDSFYHALIYLSKLKIPSGGSLMYSAGNNKPFATPIFRLPPEVLLNVLAFINVRDPVSFRSELHQVYTAPQIMILRWVCRIFRHLSCALRFWTESRDFSEIFWMAPRRESARLFATILKDQHLAVQLSKRSQWAFWDHDLFTTVSSLVPDFHTTAQNLEFHGFHDYNHLIRSIARCRDLTSLVLYSGISINLSLIPQCCPFLAELSIVHFDVYYGSLKECSALRELSFDGRAAISHQLRTYLPCKSSKSLLSLSLCTLRLSPESHGAFDAFSNLRSLRITGSRNSEVYSVVAHSSIALRELDVDIPRDDTVLGPFFEMFDSPALCHLEFLRITERAPASQQLYPNSFYWKRDGKLLHMITRALRHLQALELEMRINSHWIPLLARLPSLENLKWTILNAPPRSEDYSMISGMDILFEDYLESQGDETGDDAVHLSVGELETIFRDVWRSSLNPLPSVIIPRRTNYLSEEEEDGF